MSRFTGIAIALALACGICVLYARVLVPAYRSCRSEGKEVSRCLHLLVR